MTDSLSLNEVLASRPQSVEGEALNAIILNLAQAGLRLARLIARGPFSGNLSAATGDHGAGDSQKQLDILAHDIFAAALTGTAVAALASEEADEPQIFDESALFTVALDPLDGSTNIETNLTTATIFSIMPRNGLHPVQALLQPGHAQAAAGFIMYGPQTALVLTMGAGTEICVYDPERGDFFQIAAQANIPPNTQEYAINASNARHWEGGIRSYVADCLAGAQGSRGKDFNTRWVATMAADAYRVLVRGGIYLYPADRRKGYGHGRLRLTYEANPVAFLIEQAGGRATDGTRRILDIVPEDVHQRIPFVFGSAEEVDMVRRYIETAHMDSERSPLFSERNLFRL